MKKYGRLEKVDLREIWNSGASDFTAWLSHDENIGELGNVIGMELEVRAQDQKGVVSLADLLCKDILTDHYVLIGNQLERTDHAYLGQLIAHAAAMEAETVIWLARTFTEEHLATINWLNKITNKSTKFFGLEIEAYKIGDSLPAPVFNIVIKPEDWVRQEKKSTSTQKLTDHELLQLEYWKELKNFLEESNSFVRLLGTPPKSWFNGTIDRGKYFLSVAVNSLDSSLNISFTIIGEKARDDFDKLYEIAYKDSLTEISKDLVWYAMQANVKSVVTLKTYADFTVKSDWTNQFIWFKDHLERFDKYFRPKVSRICQ
jgi:Domain of unknown function (DUF4268)